MGSMLMRSREPRLGSAGNLPAFFGNIAEKNASASCRSRQASCLHSPEKTVLVRHQNQHARRVRYPKDSLHHAFYFFGVTDGLAAAPPSSTAKFQCASTFLPPDFASTITLHLSRNFFVT